MTLVLHRFRDAYLTCMTASDPNDLEQSFSLDTTVKMTVHVI